MPYSLQTWVDKNASFPLSAARMNHLDQGVLYASIYLNVKEAPFNAKGDGVTDDTAAIQAALNEAAGGGVEITVVIPQGTYLITSALKVPGNVAILGLGRFNCRLKAKGNINLFQLSEGGNEISNLTVLAETAQASGAAFDFSHGFSAKAYIHDIVLGSNFFNGFYCVGETNEIGALHFQRIAFGEPGTGVKSYGNAAFVFGSSTRRVAVVEMDDIQCLAAATTDMPKWFEINNTDSCQGTNIALQNGKEGVCVGNADTSPLKTTGLHLTDIFCDTMSTLGYKLERCKDTTLTAANAQNCGEGLFAGPEVIGGLLNGGTIQSNKRHGIRIGPTCLSFTITGGTKISDNNSNGELEAEHIAGVYIEGGARGIVIVGNTIGNFLFYGEKQSYGVYFAAGGKTKNCLVEGNRIPEKGTGGGAENKVKAISYNAEGTEAENKVVTTPNLLA